MRKTEFFAGGLVSGPTMKDVFFFWGGGSQSLHGRSRMALDPRVGGARLNEKHFLIPEQLRVKKY